MVESGTIVEIRNPHCFYHYTTDKSILLNLLTKQSWCLSESKFPVCANFFQFTMKEILDGTDVDSHFYHNISETFQSQHQRVRTSKGSNKMSFTFKLFLICDLKIQNRYIFQEEVIFFQRRTQFIGQQFAQFSQNFW